MKQMNAARFKAQCLAVLDQVAATGEPILILKRGRPVARVVPPGPPTATIPQDELRGSVEIVGDIIAPILPPQLWESEGRPRRP
jgi:prevent-host-death family protein